MRVLILGARAPVALDHARRFARAGHVVYVGDSVPCRISGSSCAVKEALRLPPPRTALASFAAALARAIDTHRIDLVLPTCEEAFFVSRIRSQLPSACRAFVAPFETMRGLHSKLAFLDTARACGAAVPESHAATSLAEARAWAGLRPVVLKPEYSRFGVHVRLHPDGIPADAPPLPPLGRWVVQAYQAGRELCSYAIADRGRLLLNVCYAPSYRLARSSSYYFDPVAQPAIDAFAARLVAALEYTGQISFDWIVRADGTPVVLECNPRAISGLHLVPRALDVPGAILGSHATVPLEAATLEPRMLAAVMLGAGLPSALRAGRVAQWHRDWRRARDVLAEPGDHAPLAGAVRDMLSFAGIASQRRCSLREASTRDIEWDGEELQA